MALKIVVLYKNRKILAKDINYTIFKVKFNLSHFKRMIIRIIVYSKYFIKILCIQHIRLNNA